MRQAIKEKSVYCLSLGCAKNGVDSERIAGFLRGAGYEIAAEADGAEICLVNTCGFIRSAVEENIDVILDLAGMKAAGRTKRIAVVGCLINRYGAEELAKNIPEVDCWVKSEDYDGILSAVGAAPERADTPGRMLLPASPSHLAYLKISEGCDKRCSYCIIPSIRGSLRSVPLVDLVSEAEGLVSRGASEICLVGQDLTAYGADLGINDALIKLLDALETSLPSDVWLRLLYLQPSGVGVKLLERVASGRLVLPYLDMPIQHASDRVLSLMNRGETYESLLELFKKAREIRPDFALRTTCMVGFPGEKREDFEILLRFLREAELDRVGAFAFSPEDGTPAAKMPDQVTERTKKSRLGRLMSVQEEVSLARQSLYLGREIDVLIDSAPLEGLAEGRSFREAPEVDGLIEIQGARSDLRVGERIRAIVTDVTEHDMIAAEVLR
ncbi:MAG: 30S ribosomal protein S12 methylthiotransferase RimO [Synergistaceae bacterium]|nr:30S ribosomal protein S12 methylthiotransferase RimO [Synergistaceae bacterium]